MIDNIEPDRKIIMAVDLYARPLQHGMILTCSSGTTYSGLAWAQTRKVWDSWVEFSTEAFLTDISRNCKLLSYSGQMLHLVA